MRSILAGLVILLMATPVLAQTKGEVESIGFGGYIRPDTWNPMVVRIRPGTLEAGYYQIQVEQKDNDEDTQVFTRVIQVNASEAAREQRYWMYFIPQPTGKGLPDAGAGANVRDLSAELKVWLCNKDGKQLEPLPLTSTIRSVDSGITFTQRRLSRKLVLCVTDGSSRPIFEEYVQSYGVPEDIMAVIVREKDLPESVLGYDGVDAVIWMSGDAGELSRAGSTRLPALTQFVKMGGRLIVTQPAERGKVEALESLLPVQLKDAGGNWLIETRERSNLLPLRLWAKPLINDPRTGRPDPLKNAWLQQRDPITRGLRPFGPFKVAHASAVKPGAMVVETIDWNASDGGTSPVKDESPYLVRWGLGLGQVTWVAQNLGDTSLTNTVRVGSGWIGVWDKVLDLRSEPFLFPPQGSAFTAEHDKAQKTYGGGNYADLGYTFKDAVEHTARGAGLVVLAIGFFILYWAAAGPISYFVLANKKRKGASWPIFAASALVATALTVGVVRLVMGASADIKHVTFVRWTPSQPAMVESRVGIYLTKSSVINVGLNDADPESSSYVAAYNPHPNLWDSAGGFVGKQRYPVWVVKDEDANAPTSLNVPFRSTLKKLQARWSGQMPGLEGRVSLTEATESEPRAIITGKLTNSTGRDLKHVYVAFTARRANGEGYEDFVYYVPGWQKGQTIDLDKELTGLKSLPFVSIDGQESALAVRPGGSKIIRDRILGPDDNWAKYWLSNNVRNGAAGGNRVTDDNNYLRSFALMSLYERLPVVKRTESTERVDVKRLGSRRFDMSPAISAGELVILAQDAANDINGKAASPLPYPLEVDGDKIPGNGVTFYQFALPMARTIPAPPLPPATQPSGELGPAPATQPEVEK